MNRKKDRRICHTKKFLKEALIELLKEKPLTKITITELCQKADINRNTFYCHYTLPEDILSEIEEEILCNLEDLFNEKNRDKEDTNLVYAICKLLKDNPDLSYVLFKNIDKSFINQLIALCHDKNIHDWKKISQYTNDETAEMFYRFTLSGATSIIQEWCNNGFKEPLDKIANFIEKLSLFGLNGFISNK